MTIEAVVLPDEEAAVIADQEDSYLRSRMAQRGATMWWNVEGEQV